MPVSNAHEQSRPSCSVRQRIWRVEGMEESTPALLPNTHGSDDALHSRTEAASHSPSVAGTHTASRHSTANVSLISHATMDAHNDANNTFGDGCAWEHKGKDGWSKSRSACSHRMWNGRQWTPSTIVKDDDDQSSVCFHTIYPQQSLQINQTNQNRHVRVRS